MPINKQTRHTKKPFGLLGKVKCNCIMTMSPWQIYGSDGQHQASSPLNFVILLLHNAHGEKQNIVAMDNIECRVCVSNK